MRSTVAFHAPASSTALDRSDSGSPGSVRTRPGTDSVAAGCSAAGRVTVGNSAATAFGACARPGHARRGEHRGRAAETVAGDAQLGRGAR